MRLRKRRFLRELHRRNPENHFLQIVITVLWHINGFVKISARGGAKTARLWTYVRDDRPFAGHAPPAAAFFYSPDRSGTHPEAHLATYAGPMQADAYAGFNRLYDPSRKPGPIIEVGCWAHARRKFFEIARLKKAPKL